MAVTHAAAILPGTSKPLVIQQIETPHPGPNEVLIRNHTIAIQPLDAKMLISAYGPAASLTYPAVLGSSGAGVVEKVGTAVTQLQAGDRVVFDTKAYIDAAVNKTQGTWQQLVISNANTVAKIGTTPFETAVLINFPLQTAVAALHVFLGMGKPSATPTPSLKDERVLIWGAGGAVGQYAVQYAASVGHTVIATASPRSSSTLHTLGADSVLDYSAADVVAQLAALGPYAYVLTASGDALSQSSISTLLQPAGGRFASVLPLSNTLPANVEIVYTAFSQAAQKDEYAEWREWWYGTYLPQVLSEESVEAVKYKKVEGGLKPLQSASQDVFEGKVRGKVVIDPQE